jgi:hypothetical protein
LAARLLALDEALLDVGVGDAGALLLLLDELGALLGGALLGGGVLLGGGELLGGELLGSELRLFLELLGFALLRVI